MRVKVYKSKSIKKVQQKKTDRFKKLSLRHYAYQKYIILFFSKV